MGFPGLHCILCGQEDCVSLALLDCETFKCSECDEEFTREALAEHIAAWQRVLVWVDSVPQAVAGKVA